MRQRSLAGPQQPTAQSLPDTFLLFINIPIEYQANLWLANMCTWSHTNTPYLGNARRIKNKKEKKDSKAYSTYKSWIIFLDPTAVNFPKAAAKKSNDQQKQGNSLNTHPAALSSLERKKKCRLVDSFF